MRLLLLPFLVLAITGLMLSLITHLFAWFGHMGPLGDDAWCLHVGIFVVWVPAVLVAARLSKGYRRDQIWNAVLRGCPFWMRGMTSAFNWYAFVNFGLVFAIMIGSLANGQLPDETRVVAGFSSVWMVFYSMATAILYSGRAVW